MEEEVLILPTEDRVEVACETFNEQNAVLEEALRLLREQYPRNDQRAPVLLKVVVLNRLYFTNIMDVHGMAERICAAEIDSKIDVGSPEVVDEIAKLGRKRLEYSFASKYCSWHNPERYPIWDSNVRRYLLALKSSPFSELLGTNPYLWDQYREFVKLMEGFRRFYKLDRFSFKDIDKFLWNYGEKMKAIGRAVEGS